MASEALKTQLVVFDFDWSFVDQDTDRYVLEVLSPILRVSLQEHKKTLQWTDNVAMHLVKLHEEGKTQKEIENSLQKLPVHPAMIRGVQTVKSRSSPSTKFFCLSNSNTVYIDTILKHHGLEDQFVEIVTNPAKFEGNGLLNLKRRVDPEETQHDCQIGCSANMCKGQELEAFISRHGGWEAFDRVVYVGDGNNDFCPLLHLRSQDVGLVRINRGLSRRIVKEKDALPLKCHVEYWDGAWEVERFLMGGY